MRRIVFGVLLLGLAAPVRAQMVLPGAVAPSPVGAVQSVPGASKPKPPVIINHIAGEEAVVGRPLHLNGRQGTIELIKTTDGLGLAKLLLAGNMISRPGDSCQVDVVSGAPAPLSPRGKPDGVLRFENDMPACSFTLDVLQGAALLKASAEVCTFAAADCKVRPGGMWGPSPASIGPDQINADTRARTGAETSLRASFKSLMERHSNRNETRVLASEQAGFSSQREEICRDYAGEDKHGFCATRFTEAKVASLRARLGDKTEASNAPPKPRHKRKPVAAPLPFDAAPMPLN